MLQVGFWEGRHWRPNAALWRKDWSIKPAGKMWKKLVFETWWTKEKRNTDKSGLCTISAFLGDYEVVGEYADRKVSARVTVDKTGQVKTVSF